MKLTARGASVEARQLIPVFCGQQEGNVSAGIQWLIGGLLLAASSTTAEPKISLKLELPRSVGRGASIRVIFSVSNSGNQGTYFKRPWKWATNVYRSDCIRIISARVATRGERREYEENA
jgi:hypothetical protein